MCFRQIIILNGVHARHDRHCTHGKHLNQDCARAPAKARQHLKNRPCIEPVVSGKSTHFETLAVALRAWGL